MPKDKSSADFRFDVAFSFTENYRQRIMQYDKLLSNRIKPEKIFFDDRFLAEIAGLNADLILQDFYYKNSRLIVVFLCKAYSESQWCCNVEWRAIRDLIKTGERERILLLRFDEAEIPGVYSFDICPNINAWEPAKVAEFIWDRLKLIRKKKDENGGGHDVGAQTRVQSIQIYLSRMKELEVISPHQSASIESGCIVENDFNTIYFRDMSESVTARGDKVKFEEVVKLLTDRHARVVVFGESGVGKTTLARAVCRWLAANEKGSIVPVYLPVRFWKKTLGDDLAAAPDKALGHMIPILGCRLCDIPELLNASGKKLVLVVDGLNECTDAEKIIINRSALSIVQQTTKSSLLMTSRRVAFPRDEFDRQDHGFRMYELCPWTTDQLKMYWSANGLDPEAIDRFPEEMRSAMRLPLFAWMAAQEYRYGHNREQTPATLTDLFQRFMDRATNTFSEKARLASGSNVLSGDIRRALQKLAFQMTHQSLLEVNGSDIYEYAGKLRIDWKQMLYALIENDLLRLAQEPVFVEDRQDEDVSRLKIMFFHQAIQEMLTAEYILDAYDPISFFQDYNFHGDQQMSGNVSEHAFWREIPIYLMSLLVTPDKQYKYTARDFVQGFIRHKDYHTAARAASLLPFPEKNNVRSQIASMLITEMENQDSYAQSKEAFWELGEEGRRLLLEEIKPSNDILQIIPRPEFHLHAQDIIKDLKIRFNDNDEDIERRWRRYGRIITILGELREERMINALDKSLVNIQSLHLIYHCLESFLLLIQDTDGSARKLNRLINLPILYEWRNHKDPIIAAYSTLLSTDEKEASGLASVSRHLIRFLKEKNDPGHENFAAEFWQRAHGHLVVQEICDWQDGYSLACDALEKECTAPKQVYFGFPSYQAVISAITTALARRQRRERLNFDDIREFLNIALQSDRYSEVDWACIQLEHLLITVCKRKEKPFVSYFLDYWKKKGNLRIVQLLTNVLHTVDRLPQ